METEPGLLLSGGVNRSFYGLPSSVGGVNMSFYERPSSVGGARWRKLHNTLA